YKSPSQEHSIASTSYTFDKVFGPISATEAVYEGVKNVALSALIGINATIFAYGQTSSGNTYTMREITEKTVNDIYNHILNTPERDFSIKISGLEIYNENVRDLLNSDSGHNLKFLDDPEKGTVVEKLVEETANGDQHLRHLISICEVLLHQLRIPLNSTVIISPVYISDEIPILSQDVGDNKIDVMNSESLIGDVNGTGNFGIVLVHGFGGGVFSWRHVMGGLAWQFGCLVAAFDRPADLLQLIKF
ncbi:hypothetical protein IFM89_039171, partial [Coptis chinensis]